MTYRSFVTLFKFAQLKGLVELVEERDMEFPPKSGGLISIRHEGGEVEVVPSKIRVFRLTQSGSQDERSWANLCKSWMEGWPVPQPLQYKIPETKPTPSGIPVVEKKTTWTSLVRTQSYTVRRASMMKDHLETLDAIGINTKGVRDELDHVRSILADWETDLDIKIEREEKKKAPDDELLERYETNRSNIVTVGELLEEHELKEAIEAMEDLI